MGDNCTRVYVKSLKIFWASWNNELTLKFRAKIKENL